MESQKFFRAFFLYFSALGSVVAQAGCLEESPKPSSSLFEKCNSLGTFGINRGSRPYLPYELAEDGLGKEHSPPMGPRTFLLDFTRKNTGRLHDLMEGELTELCSYYYEGQKYNLKDGKDKMAFHLRKHKARAFEKALLKQVFEKENKLTVADLARLSKEFGEKATKLGDGSSRLTVECSALSARV